MLNKIREYFVKKIEYKEAKKVLTLLLLNQFNELLKDQNILVEEQLKLTEQMKNLNDEFSAEDIRKLMADISRITADPKLTSEYFNQVSKQA
ncbi:hypothetical protein [Lacrimispora brassicae]